MSWSSYPLGRNMGRPLMNGDAISPSPTTAMDATMLSPLATCREIPLSWCQTFSRMFSRMRTTKIFRSREILTDVGTLTSSCSITLPSMGGMFPASCDRVACVAESAHNMVHCDVWSDAGATYLARRLEQNAEFIASTFAWFRPVNMYIGPDGALYLIDYYRNTIEHPEW